MDFLDDFKARQLFHQCTDEEALRKALASGPVTAYIGFDPTATSLHVGSLLPVMNLVRFARAGHRPIALVGGATGLVGDPSGKQTERAMLAREELEKNLAGLRAQLGKYLDFSGRDGGARMVDNLEWLGPVSFLSFLRDVGRHVSVNTMMHRESVRARLEDREQGISYTEFSYMLLQAYDFVALHERYGCTLQMGGSDQWGNILSGIDLIRRMRGGEAYGLTTPLLTKADGTKYGKSERGNVWIDPALTSPYEFYQFFLNSADADVEKLLLQLTLVPVDEIAEVMREHAKEPSHRLAQRRLAESVTRFVHGDAAAVKAMYTTRVFFGGVDWKGLPAEELDAAFGDAPHSTLARAALGTPDAELLAVLVKAELYKSKSEARRGVEGGGVSVNGAKVDRADVKRVLGASDLLPGSFIVLTKGGRTHHAVRVVG